MRRSPASPSRRGRAGRARWPPGPQALGQIARLPPGGRERAEQDDDHGDNADQGQHPGEARRHARPGRQPDEQVDQDLRDPEHGDASELSGDEHRGSDRGQGDAVEKAGLDVIPERGSRDGHRARGALDHRRGEEEGRVVVGWESLDPGRLLAGPARDDRASMNSGKTKFGTTMIG